MDDKPSQENPAKDFNKLDLSQLQGFSFGTQWTQEKPGSREPRRDDRPRDDRFTADPRRDRRGFRKPLGAPTEGATGDSREGGEGRPAHVRRDRGEYRGGPRREGAHAEGPGGGRGYARDQRPEERGPYISPFFNVTFYPEDLSFTALSKTIRNSCRTFELFDIAKTVIGKPDRFVVVLQRKPAAANAKPEPIAIAVPDGLPFESEEAAISHVLSQHLNEFFDTAEVEVEAPRGNFQVINKCGITGELLGPPNYHRYNHIIQQHHANHLTRMSFEAFRGRVETVRDPESINQWLEKMKKVTRYTWKLPHEGELVPVFDSLEEARNFVILNARDRLVKSIDTVRFPGKVMEQLPPGEIRRAIEGTLERQRRFPLDTANALRGRLRREGFTIFKKGSKGVSYVCAVKRRFRVPGQTFADTIGALIAFIEGHPMVRASELPSKFLDIHAPPAEEGDGAAEHALPAAEREKLNRLQGDLRWLVTEGYVTEFIDGRLFAAPPMTEARKREVEKDEHDPENFPEVEASGREPAAPAKRAARQTEAPAAKDAESGFPAEATPAEGGDATEEPAASGSPAEETAERPAEEAEAARPAETEAGTEETAEAPAPAEDAAVQTPAETSEPASAPPEAQAATPAEAAVETAPSSSEPAAPVEVETPANGETAQEETAASTGETAPDSEQPASASDNDVVAPARQDAST